MSSTLVIDRIPGKPRMNHKIPYRTNSTKDVIRRKRRKITRRIKIENPHQCLLTNQLCKADTVYHYHEHEHESVESVNILKRFYNAPQSVTNRIFTKVISLENVLFYLRNNINVNATRYYLVNEIVILSNSLEESFYSKY